MISPSFSVFRGRTFSTLAYHLFLPGIPEALRGSNVSACMDYK